MSRERRRTRCLVAALTALLWGASGITCADIVTSTATAGTPEASAVLWVEVDRVFPLAIGGHGAFVNLVVQADQPFQACNLKLSWKSDAVKFASALTHPEFDDDGVLFGTEKLGTRSLSNIVELRHGSGAAVLGTVRVAKVFLRFQTAGSIQLTAGGEIAAPDGTRLTVVVGEPTIITPGS